MDKKRRKGNSLLSGPPTTAGRKGLDVHTVDEATRINFTRKLEAFREDENAVSLAFPPSLDNTQRKFLHTLAKSMGLKSKSTGKTSRFITVSKLRKGRRSEDDSDEDDDGTPRLPELEPRGHVLLQTHFSVHSIGPEELRTVMAAAMGEGMHTASELATQTRQQGRLLAKQAQAAAAQAPRPHEQQQRVAAHMAARAARGANRAYESMERLRRSLPAWEYRDKVLELVKNHRVVLISGETGCGKSTQVPQFILDDDELGPTCKICCTQPRRISAIAVAERIAEERCEQPGNVIGYQIRLESAVSRNTQLVLMTPGVLLKKLNGDPMLREYTMVIIDEVHERDKNSEFLLIVMRELLEARPDLRLVLMSATLHQQKCSEYFGGCPVATIGARIFPVQQFFLEDVLAQTGYLDGLDGYGGGGGGGHGGGGRQGSGLGGGGGGGGLLFLDPTVPPPSAVYGCIMCGRSGFRSPEELGSHVALCFGPDGMDPLADGVDPNDLLDGAGGAGALITNAADDGAGAGPGSGGAVNRGPVNGGGGGFGGGDASGGTTNGKGSLLLDGGAVFQLDATATAPPGDGFMAVSNRENGVMDGSAMLVAAADRARAPAVTGAGADAFSRTAAGSGLDGSGDGVGDGGEDEEGADDYEDEEDRLSEGSSTGDGAVAAMQKWDGTGDFRMQRADARTDELLQRYQFAFDDEQVDYELIAALLKYICESAYEDGAILVFLPGWDDITRLQDLLRRHPYFSDASRFLVLPLHSGVPSKKQREVFRRPPPGCRKLVLSTNIAETSITIDDVSFVVDSGRAKEQSYDPHLKLRTLVPQWISKASARQRRGRAGRTKAGVCFHLFSARRHESLREYRESELLRTPLEEICLQAKVLGLAPGGPGAPDGLASFLGKAMDPPHPKTLHNAVELLRGIGALDANEGITDLGVRLSGLSLDPRVGKMILWSYLLGCAQPTVLAACAMTYKDPFVLPMSPAQRREAAMSKVSLAQGSESDLIALLNAVKGWRTAQQCSGQGGAYAFADRNFLSGSTVGMISDICEQVARELTALGLPGPNSGGSPNANCHDISLLSSVLCAGIYPNVAARCAGATNFKTASGHAARIHVSSVNAGKQQRLSQPCTAAGREFVAFGEVTRTANQFVLSVTAPVAPLALLLLCGNLRARRAGGRDGGGSDDESESSGVDDGGEGGGGGGVGGGGEAWPRGGEVDAAEAWAGGDDDGDLVLVLDDWIYFQAPRALAQQLLVLRHRLHGAFARHTQAPKAPLPPASCDAVSAAAALLHDPSIRQAAANHRRPPGGGTVGGGGGRGGGRDISGGDGSSAGGYNGYGGRGGRTGNGGDGGGGGGGGGTTGGGGSSSGCRAPVSVVMRPVAILAHGRGRGSRGGRGGRGRAL